MMSPQVIIKSQVVDDKFSVDLNEILEKYGVKGEYDEKMITLQIYNQGCDDEPLFITYDNSDIVNVVVNSTITITKFSNGTVYIQGMLFDGNQNYIPFLEIASGNYENGIKLIMSSYMFDLYVIRV